MDLDLESLRCFVAGAEQLHFGRAAASVALSPAAFGTRVRKLEETLGAPLFERTTRSVLLTGAGHALLPQARRCLHEAERCAAVVRDGDRSPFSLTLGTRFELGLSYLVPAIDPLARARPERTLHLSFGDSAELLARLRRRELDAVVTSARIHDAGLQYARLHEEHYVFVGHPRVLRDGPVRGPADVSQHVLVDAHPDLPLFRYFLDARPSHESWRFGSLCYFGAIAAIRARVLAGAGLAVLPLYFVREDLKRKRLQRVLQRTRLGSDWFRLIWHATHPRDAELRELAAELAARELQ